MSAPDDDQAQADFVLNYLAGLRDCEGHCGRRVEVGRDAIYGGHLLCFWCTMNRISEQTTETMKFCMINIDGYPKLPALTSDKDK